MQQHFSAAVAPFEVRAHGDQRGNGGVVAPGTMLAVQHGGSVLTRDQDGQLVPERAVYRVVLQAPGEPGALAGHAWRGQVVIQGRWEAPAAQYLRSALALLWREAGF